MTSDDFCIVAPILKLEMTIYVICNYQPDPTTKVVCGHNRAKCLREFGLWLLYLAKRIVMLTSYNFCISTPILKLEMTIYVICK